LVRPGNSSAIFQWHVSQFSDGASAQFRWQNSRGQTNPGTFNGHEDRPDHHLGTMMSEHNVYGANAAQEPSKAPRTKIRTHHLQKMKAEGRKWAMLTAYDYST